MLSQETVRPNEYDCTLLVGVGVRDACNLLTRTRRARHSADLSFSLLYEISMCFSICVQCAAPVIAFAPFHFRAMVRFSGDGPRHDHAWLLGRVSLSGGPWTSGHSLQREVPSDSPNSRYSWKAGWRLQAQSYSR